MTEIEVDVGPLDLDAVRQALIAVPAERPPLLDMPQSILLARAAQISAGSLESDLSVRWVYDGSLVAYAPLCLRRGADGSLTLQGMPHPLRLPAHPPGLDEKVLRTILDFYRDHLAQALRRTDQATARVWLRGTGELLRDSSEARWLTAVPTVGAAVDLDVDLEPTPERMWSEIRKSYRSLINRGRRELLTSIATHDDAESDVSISVAELARLHAEAAGRSVYDDRLWDVVGDLVHAGSAACLLVHQHTRAIGGLLMLLDRPRASYAIGAYDRDLMAEGLPIGHTAMWEAMSWLREQGFTRLSLGAGPTPPVEGKEAGIDQFKRGFATVLAPWLVTEIAR